ncbi:SGNH/GDSL hydrolase family protein [Jatrophihabitans sp. YIM 134969]
MTLEYSNLSTRPTSRFMRLARRILPGVDLVEGEIRPYADLWHERNIAALSGTDPLWVALGDSLSQGVGASSIDQGWVMQAQRQLARADRRYRVINLSVSGARVQDVIDRQLPAIGGLAATPALVTVLIGSNDIVKRDLRAQLPEHFATLLSLLPRGTVVGTVPTEHGTQGRLNAMVQEAARTGAVVAAPLRFGGGRAPDHFHPDDAGYAAIAAGFVEAVEGLDRGQSRGSLGST